MLTSVSEPPDARAVRVALALAVVPACLAPRRAAVAVPLAPLRAVLAVLLAALPAVLAAADGAAAAG